MSIVKNSHIVERTTRIEIECPETGSYTVKAYRHEVIVDADGKPIMRDGKALEIPGSRYDFTRTISADDPEAVQIAGLVAAKIDSWSQEQ